MEKSRARWVFGGVAALAAALAGQVAAPAAARAEIRSVFDDAIDCAPVASADGEPDVRWCGGEATRVPSLDGTMIDVNVALPPAPREGSDGPYPLVMVFHGWGGSELGANALAGWARRGFAAFSMSDRGFGESCGGGPAALAEAGCENGYIRLMDTRYEVRDAQHFAGVLADEGVAEPRRIGATGGSYGGGLSMALGALRSRVMLPDGELEGWRSPGGLRMEIAAAAPDIPWTDLAYSLMPNGHTLDYVADAPYLARDRIGVMKLSYVTGLYAAGAATGRYAPPLADPDADLTSWFARVSAGEPYDDDPRAAEIVDEITSHHSSYYIDDGIKPAPMLISNGWTDDLFPADEAIRFYNRTRTEHPDADISLFFADHGHARGQNRRTDLALLRQRQREWLTYYLRQPAASAGGPNDAPAGSREREQSGFRSQGDPKPFEGVEALTQTCGGEDSPARYLAGSWAEIARGEVRHSAPESRIVAPEAADLVGRDLDPLVGGGACAVTPADDQAGAASYRFEVADPGYTLLGSPTIVAKIASPGPNSQLAARLFDVAPGSDSQTLVARGVYRPETGVEPTLQVFQLHPNGYRFEGDHEVKLELLPADAPTHRTSNGQTPIMISELELRLPVRERPGGDTIKRPAGKVLPEGYQLARDFRRDPGR